MNTTFPGATPPSPFFRVTPVRVVLASLFALAVLVTLAIEVLAGPTVTLVNDRDVDAEVVLDGGGRRVRVRAGRVVQTRVRGDHTARVRFADGVESTFPLRSSERGRQMYALAGTSCYATVDVSKLYDRGGPHRVLAISEAGHLVDLPPERDELEPMIRPGMVSGRQTRMIWVRPAPCVASRSHAAREAFEDRIRDDPFYDYRPQEQADGP